MTFSFSFFFLPPLSHPAFYLPRDGVTRWQGGNRTTTFDCDHGIVVGSRVVHRIQGVGLFTAPEGCPCRGCHAGWVRSAALQRQRAREPAPTLLAHDPLYRGVLPAILGNVAGAR